MLRVAGRSWLWRVCCRFSNAAPVADKLKPEDNLKKYFVFPTKVPIFPHYTYYTRINEALHHLLK